MAIATTNPATGEIEKTFEALSDAEVDEHIARAAATAVEYRRTTFEQRAGWMNAAAAALEAACDEIARVMTTEMGKTIVAARAEVMKCAKGCRFYAEHAASMLADEPADAAAVGATRAYVRYEPLGPVLAVMPWNFPLWQVIRFAAPALMAGNVGLLKHASNVPQTALLIEDTFRRAGFPEGTFQTLLIGASSVERILRDPRVRAATLTGSTPAGRSIGSIAGEEIKPVVLELGGSDPFVVMPSADLEKAAQTAVTARVQNNGQSCIAAKRFIAHVDVADAFEKLFVARMKALSVGDPMDEKTDIGPLANEQGLLDVARSWKTRCAAARGCSAAGSDSTARAGSTRRRSSPTSRPRCACTTRRSSVRSRNSSAFVTPTRRSSSPTRPCSDSDRISGRPIPRSRRSSSRRSMRERCSSTV